MTDQSTSDAATSAVCPWCSAALPSPGLAQCPSCGAALKSDVDESLPGLTAIDAGAIVRAKQVAIRPKSRLLSWLSGDDPDDVFTKAEGNALEPPDDAVRREMLRMELEAEVANLQAENEAIMAEAAAEGRTVDVPPELADLARRVGVGTAGEVGEAGEMTGDEPATEATEAAEASAADASAEPPATEPAATDETPPADEAPPAKSRR